MINPGRCFLAGIVAAAACLAPAYGSAANTPAHVDTSQPNPPVPYPPELQRQGAVGSVILRVHVNADGTPVGAQIVRSSGNADLDDAAAGGVLGWHYVPAVQDGESVTDWALVRVDYKLSTPPPPATPPAH